MPFATLPLFLPVPFPPIPYRPHPSREGGLAWVKAYYEHRVGEDRVHVELDTEGGLFNKSRLVNRAAARFPGEILVIADADCVICDHSLRLAIDEVPPDQMICPHNRHSSPMQGSGHVALVAVCEPPGRTNLVLYHHLEQLAQGEGEVRFRLPSITQLRNRQGGPFSGVLPLFFQICIVGEPEKTARSALFVV